MNDIVATLSAPAVPPEVQKFAVAQGIDGYLSAAVDLALQAFPSSPPHVSLGQDAEDETHRYIALDIDARGLSTDELLAGQRNWSVGMSRVCPPRYAVYFVLGWR